MSPAFYEEWTVQYATKPDFSDARELIVPNGVRGEYGRELAQERYRDLVSSENTNGFFRVVKRDVSLGEWEPA
jgi:hypothetical protein